MFLYDSKILPKRKEGNKIPSNFPNSIFYYYITYFEKFVKSYYSNKDILKLMTTITRTKTKSGIITVPSEIMRAILEELRLLRQEMLLLFPQEDLEDYAYPDRIKNSYRKAIKEYPLVSL